MYCLVFLFLAKTLVELALRHHLLMPYSFALHSLLHVFSVVRQMVGNTKSLSGNAEARDFYLPFNVQHKVPAPFRPFRSPGLTMLHALSLFFCTCPTRGLVKKFSLSCPIVSRTRPETGGAHLVIDLLL